VTGAPEVAAPLCAVDRWRAAQDGDTWTITARIVVDGDEPNLRGHFPGLAVYPGIFVVETLSQAVALALPASGPQPPALRVVRSVRFLAPLLDGDELNLDITAMPLGCDVDGPGGGWDVRAVGTRAADGTTTARVRAEYGPDVVSGKWCQSTICHSQAVRQHGGIRAVLPQRHPLLLVDRVVRLDPGGSITTVKAITGTEPCYAGLPDGEREWRYGYPRSLMIESFGQSAALLWLDGHAPSLDDDLVLMFAGARDYVFEGSAYPGDVLRHEVRLESVVADTAFASGETWAGDRRIATVDTLIATRRPVRPVRPVGTSNR
jgi:3-hydroxyacyl-[acyl-carrier-protein] dehydratase